MLRKILMEPIDSDRDIAEKEAQDSARDIANASTQKLNPQAFRANFVHMPASFAPGESDFAPGQPAYGRMDFADTPTKLISVQPDLANAQMDFAFMPAQPYAVGSQADSAQAQPDIFQVKKPEPVAAEAAGQAAFTKRETILTMVGVLMVMLLSALDQTIVGTALPRIVADLNGFDQYTWVTTAYLLTSTVMVPIYGKLSDIFGRKPIFMIGVILFLTGSALSGASQTMLQLILFRGFQGIGAGALMPIALTVVGDLFTPRERGKWQGVTGAVFGISSILGPTLGGWIADNFTWRWIFYVNLPVGISAMLVLIFLMPQLHAKNRNARIDYIGCALIALGTVPMLLGFTWAGTTYPWISWQVLGLIIGGVIVLGLFAVYEVALERRNAQPIIEPGLFRSGIFSVSSLVTIIFGMGLFGSVYFIPLFVQGVLNASATNSGVVLMPLMLTAMAASIISGQLVSRFGRYKWLTVLSMAISVVGTYLLFRLDVHSSNWDVVIAMLILGFGMGVGMSLYTLIVQNALPKKMAQATSALTFFRQIGATIGLAAMGSVMISAFPSAFTSALPASVASALPAGVVSRLSNPNNLLNPVQPTTGPQLPHTPQALALYQQLMNAMKHALAQSVHNVFVLCLFIMIAGLISVFFLKEIRLRDKRSSVESSEEEAAMESGLTAVL